METPKVSIVIASHNCASVIVQCLSALEGQAGREMAEVIVADSSSDETAALIQDHFPDVRLLHFSNLMTVPELRGAAIAAAQGEIIAILDPYCIVDGEWITELLRVHAERPEPAIGGAVELESAHCQSLVRWATYLCEYDAFMPPLEAGPAAELTGNNISYKRVALGEAEELSYTGFWKTFVNWQLRAGGHQLWTDPLLVVKLRKPIPFMEFFRSRYQHGRCFAAMRVSGAPRYIRWLRALTAPLLPYLALWRQARSTWPERRHRVKSLMAAPLVFLLFSSWAWGEMWGYLRGQGGSCARLFY